MVFIGHSELMLSGNIDPNHMGRVTLGIHSDNTLEIEEAFLQILD